MRAPPPLNYTQLYYYYYDQAGNLTQRVANSVLSRYNYNAQNKLTSIYGEGFTNEFKYDNANRRIGLSHNGEWRYFIHDGNVPIAEVDSATNVTRWFVRGLGIADGTGDVLAEIVPTGTTETVHFYLSNHRGDTLLTLTNNGCVETVIGYDAFGNKDKQIGSFLPRYMFSTKEYLSDAKLYLYAYRVYDPIAGRWTQRDPIGFQDSENLYQFCGNNPVNGWDPDGQSIFGDIGSGLKNLGKQSVNVAGKIWAAPNTAIGLTLGVAGHVVSGTRKAFTGVDDGFKMTLGYNAIQFENFSLIDGAITLGNTISYNNTDGTTPSFAGKEERCHTYQGEITGPLYLPLHIAGGTYSVLKNWDFSNYGWHKDNFMEKGPMTRPNPKIF